MTGANINSFVGDLVTMAKAFEDLPKVQAELDSAKAQIIHDGQTIARLEMKLQDRANEIAELTSRIRSLEVERDDASFRQLEAEDKFDALRRAIGTVQATLGEAVKATEPEPKVEEPKPEAEAQPEQKSAGSWAMPQSEPVTDVSGSQPQGQSEVGPILDHLTSTGTGMENAASSSEPESKPQPYADKRYYDHPTYVTVHDWLAGGGTEEDYHWRPGVAHPRASNL